MHRYKKPPQELIDNAKKMDKGKELLPSIPANRAAAALKLRINGAGFADIAEVLAFTDAAEARRAVERALASEPTDMGDVERVRTLESRRIDRILTSIMTRATNPKDPDHLMYARTALAAIKQQSDLHGAAMPTKVDISYNPSAQQLEQWVSKVSSAMHSGVVEGDIIDVEEVTEEEPVKEPYNGLEEF